MVICSRCKAVAKIVDYRGTKCIVCEKCGLDERNIYEQYPENKSSQKAKARYSPYKMGGSTRTKK
ncbi:hypothetical protein HQ545_07240 [Candidatus Woesearchaeota archaeon]|nr:hypothetical protein [Candidatus Woesearchaeota archaeon]